jgi:chromosome segregation ATPase
VQPLVVAAVRRLRNQVESLQQQLAEADAGSRGSDASAVRLRQRLAELREQHDQVVDATEQLQHDKKQLSTRCRQLSLQLQEKEQELEQAQV